MNKTVASCLPPDQWQQLESLLHTCGDENTFSALECHGLACAASIYPADIAENELYEIIFDGEFDPQQTDFAALRQLINQLNNHIETGLEQGHAVMPPCPLTIDDNVTKDTDTPPPIRLWASAFMQGVFLREQEWFDKDEDLVAQMSLPILVTSELVESEEIIEIQKDLKLLNTLCKEIPNTLTDMYLFFRVS